MINQYIRIMGNQRRRRVRGRNGGRKREIGRERKKINLYLYKERDKKRQRPEDKVSGRRKN